VTLSGTEIKQALARAAAAMAAHEQDLNKADARLGDGDTGITLRRISDAMRDAAATLSDEPPADLGELFRKAGMAAAAATGSSLGTLVAFSFIALGKSLAGRSTLEPSEVAGLVRLALETMTARGGARLGDKTVLDSLDAVATALGSQDETQSPATRAAIAATEALETFRGRKNLIGRARMFGEKSIDLDDPGMLAMAILTRAFVD
jgi:dihydroxyacetone kinase-like protein